MRADRWLGLFFLLFAAALAFVWVPLDTDTGLAEVVRRRLRVGDALGPTVAAFIIGLGAVLLLVRPTTGKALGADNLRWVMALLAVFAVSLAVMRYTGPLVVSLMEAGEYRALRATAPWKYIGYLIGGALLVLGAHVAVTRRLSLQAVLVAIVATAVIAFLYDWPFEDLLLPPNGDF